MIQFQSNKHQKESQDCVVQHMILLMNIFKNGDAEFL